jgi:hypothetical protein
MILPVPVAERSEARTGTVGSNSTWGMDVCLRFPVLCGRGLASGRSPVQGVLPNVQ